MASASGEQGSGEPIAEDAGEPLHLPWKSWPVARDRTTLGGLREQVRVRTSLSLSEKDAAEIGRSKWTFDVAHRGGLHGLPADPTASFDGCWT